MPSPNETACVPCSHALTWVGNISQRSTCPKYFSHFRTCPVSDYLPRKTFKLIGNCLKQPRAGSVINGFNCFRPLKIGAFERRKPDKYPTIGSRIRSGECKSTDRDSCFCEPRVFKLNESFQCAVFDKTPP